MSWLPFNRERWPLAALIIAAATLASVYVLEYVFNQAPCQMCWWQRYAWFVAAPVALVAILVRWRGAAPAVLSAFCVLLGLVFLASFFVAAWHALFEWDIAPGPEGCVATAGSIPEHVKPSDLLSQRIAIPSCKEALWRLPNTPWGLSLAGMNALLSLVLAALSLYSASQPRRKPDTANEPVPA
jgi:disulfide bond formation protein DsbB